MFYVTEEAKCPECQGSGWLTHPAWKLYYEKNGEHGILDEEGHLDVSLDVAWFQTQGYDYPPDEEVPCWVCEGEGTIRREVRSGRRVGCANQRDHRRAGGDAGRGDLPLVERNGQAASKPVVATPTENSQSRAFAL